MMRMYSVVNLTVQKYPWFSEWQQRLTAC